MSNKAFNHILPNSFQTPNAHVDDIMHHLSGDEYKVLNFAVRHILGWQSNLTDRTGEISLTMFEHGYTAKNGRRFNGTGLGRPALSSILKALVEFKLLEKVGEPTPDGQRWRIGETPDYETLEKRTTEKTEKRKQQTMKAIEGIKRKRGLSGGMSDNTGMSNNTSGGMSNNTSGGMSDNTESKTYENQDKNTAGADDTFDDWFPPVDQDAEIDTEQSAFEKHVYSLWSHPVGSARCTMLAQMLRGVCTKAGYKEGNIPVSHRIKPDELSLWYEWEMSRGVQSEDKVLIESPVKIQASVMGWVEAGRPKVDNKQSNPDREESALSGLKLTNRRR
jgi:hypothetical protein